MQKHSVKIQQAPVETAAGAQILARAAVRSLDNVTCAVVGEALAGKDFVTFVLNRAASYSVQVIISITRSGVICKMYLTDNVVKNNPDNERQG